MVDLRIRTGIAAGVLVTLLAASAAVARDAEPVPAAPPVDDLVARALDRSPSLAALQSRLSAARQRVAPAGAPMDPMVEVMVQGIAGPGAWNRGMSMGQVTYAQPLFYPGKPAARRAEAAAEADVRGAELAASRRRLAAEVRTAYARVYAIDREAETLVAARELADLFQATAAARLASGTADQEAVVKAQIAASRIDERQADLEAERAMWVVALNRLLDQPGSTPFGAVTVLPDVPAPPADVEERALENAPEVPVRQAEIRAAERRLQAARLERKPNFLVGAGLGSTWMHEAAVTLRFGIELPVFSSQKQGPAAEAARQDLDAATADLRSTRASVGAEAAGLLARFRRDAEQVTRYREAIVPRTAVALDAARASYLAGRGDFSTLIEDFTLWLDARASLARREADRFVTWSEIDALAGGAVDGGPGGTP